MNESPLYLADLFRALGFFGYRNMFYNTMYIYFYLLAIKLEGHLVGTLYLVVIVLCLIVVGLYSITQLSTIHYSLTVTVW